MFRALAEFGAPLSGLTVNDFAREGFFYQIGLPPAPIDILMSIDGLEFKDAWPNRREAEVGVERACFIGRADLVRNKRASGRHIDLHDADMLEQE